MKITIIRTDGSEECHEVSKALVFRTIDRLIGADCTYTVNLGDGRVMVVDDNGYESKCVDNGNGHFALVPMRARKPVNAKATALYHAICVPGTRHQIVGDVAIAIDADFA